MAGISIEMEGSGSIGEIVDWSINEQSNSVNAVQASGGTGGVDISAAKNSDSKYAIDNKATIIRNIDDTTSGGAFLGVVESVTPGFAGVDVHVRSNLELLNVDCIADATGIISLSQAFQSYVSLATDQITVDYQASSDPSVYYGGWEGNLWQNLKVLSAINGVELVYYGGSLIVRDRKSSTLQVDDVSGLVAEYSTETTALGLDIVNQNSAVVDSVGTTKINYSPNPSLETNANNWSGGTVNCIAAQGRAAIHPSSGTFSYRSEVTSVTGTASSQSIRHTIDVTGVPDGSIMNFSFDLYARFYLNVTTIPVPGDMIVQVSVSGDGGGPAFPVFLFQQYEWPRWQSGTSGSGYVTKKVNVTWNNYLKSGESNVYIDVSNFSIGVNPWEPQLQVGDRIAVDAVLATIGPLVPYFDGNSPGGVWTGSTNNSISYIPSGPQYSFYDAAADGKLLTISPYEKYTATVKTTNFPDYLAPLTKTGIPLYTPLSTYHVIDSNNNEIPVSDWNAASGKVVATIGENPGEIDITITGPTAAISGYQVPYYLAFWDGSSRIPSLSIAGTGLVSSPESYHIYTGADPEKTSNTSGGTLNSPFVTNATDVYNAAKWAAVDAAGPVAALRFTISPDAITDVGLTPGSVFTYDEAMYRVVDTTITYGAVRITAKHYTEIDVVEQLWENNSASVKDQFWDGFDSKDYSIAPLRYWNTTGENYLYPSTDLYPSTSLYPGVQT